MSEKRRYSQSLMPGSIAVSCNSMGLITCGRCDRTLPLQQIAFLTRTAPGEAFDAWCVDCSVTLSQWALVGAVTLGLDDDAAKSFSAFRASQGN